MTEQVPIQAIEQDFSAPREGVFTGLSNHDYHRGPGISKSGLDLIRRSPMHYSHSLTVSREPTPDQRIGTLAHALILEPESVWNYYATPFVAPEGAIATVEEIKDRLKGLELELDQSELGITFAIGPALDGRYEPARLIAQTEFRWQPAVAGAYGDGIGAQVRRWAIEAYEAHLNDQEYRLHAFRTAPSSVPRRDEIDRTLERVREMRREFRVRVGVG